MITRLELDQTLREVLGSGNVYFQPNESVRMRYPAIVYNLYDIENSPADNFPYKQNPAYQLTLIDADPDNEIVGRIALLPQCSMDRTYVADNLNHYVFTIYL